MATRTDGDFTALKSITAMIRCMADEYIECYAALYGPDSYDLSDDEMDDFETGLKTAEHFFFSDVFSSYAETVLKDSSCPVRGSYGQMAIRGLQQQALRAVPKHFTI